MNNDTQRIGIETSLVFQGIRHVQVGLSIQGQSMEKHRRFYSCHYDLCPRLRDDSI